MTFVSTQSDVSSRFCAVARLVSDSKSEMMYLSLAVRLGNCACSVSAALWLSVMIVFDFQSSERVKEEREKARRARERFHNDSKVLLACGQRAGKSARPLRLPYAPPYEHPSCWGGSSS